MTVEQIAPLTNGHSKIYPTPETDTPAKNITTVSPERLEVQQEHLDWLNKARKAQVKNRRMLALISRLESMLLDRDAKMASLVARIESHELECMRPKMVSNLEEVDQQTPSTPVYGRYHIEHTAVREIFNHLDEDEKHFKGQIQDVIDALLKSL